MAAGRSLTVRGGTGVALLLAFALLACASGSSHGSGTGAPILTLLDTVLLQESDSLVLGRSEVTFAVDDSGNFYIPDVAADRLVSFTRGGRVRLVYGRAGGGPGEIQDIFPGIAVLDSMVLQAANHTLHVFDRTSGKFRYRIPISGSISQIAVQDSTVGVASLDPTSRTGLLLLNRHDLGALAIRQPPTSVTGSVARWPAQYREYPVLLTYYSSNAIPHGDGWLVGFAGVPDLVMHPPSGLPGDTVTVPWRRRTGNASARYAALRNSPGLDGVSAVSALTELGAAEGGRVIAVHQDYQVVDAASDLPFRSRAWGSLLSSGLDPACVDAELPFPGSGWPRVTVRGDTVYALDQVVSAADSPGSFTVVRRYRVSSAGCDGLPTHRTPVGMASPR